MNISRWTRPNAQPSLPALSEAPEPAESVASETPTSDEYGLLGTPSSDGSRFAFVTVTETETETETAARAPAWPEIPGWLEAMWGPRPGRSTRVWSWCSRAARARCCRPSPPRSAAATWSSTSRCRSASRRWTRPSAVACRDWVIPTVEKNRGGQTSVDLEFQKHFEYSCFDATGRAVQEKLIEERLYND